MKLGSHFDAETRFDWLDREPAVVANPEWALRRPGDLAAAKRALPRLEAHVWVATSGTSGRSAGARWVALSKEAFLASASAVNAHLDSRSHDVWVHALPLFHVGGLGILARASLSGARVVAGIEERWDPGTFAERAAAAGATLTALVPAQVHDLVSAEIPSPPAIRAVVVGGDRLDPALWRAAKSLGWPCLPSYGMTETCSQVATAPLASIEAPGPPSALAALPHAEIRCGEEGRIEIRATSLLTAYAEIEGDAVRAWDPKRDGWLETDDLGRVAGGSVEVWGRAGEAVKVLGEIVLLPRVESRLEGWTAGDPWLRERVLDVALVARPDPRLGHELTLVVASGDPALAAPPALDRLARSLREFARAELLPFERPRRVVFLDRIPRNELGKKRRDALALEVGLHTGLDV
ncbi:MAG: AMP-binding protein [Acidobacteriia bacterium]|nr:AMP-binding protein [Terriglobia bacterium]